MRLRPTNPRPRAGLAPAVASRAASPRLPQKGQARRTLLAISTITALSTTAHAELQNRYSFNHNANDSISGQHGTLIGQASISNGALHLNGTTSTYLSLPGGLMPTGADDAITIETWLSTGVNGNWARVFDFGAHSATGTQGGDAFFLTIQSSNNDTRLRVSDGIPGFNDDHGVIVPGSLSNQPMMHLAAVYDAANDSMKLYRNGVEIGSAVVTINPDQLNNVVSYVGKSLYTGDAYLNGSISEFRIYTHALSAEKVATNYAAGPDAIVTRWTGGSGSWNSANHWDILTTPRGDWDLKVDAGVMSVDTPLAVRSLNIGQAGTADVTSAVTAAVVNAGKVIGNGVISIDGSFTQTATGELVLQIGGETGYDTLHITGVATLGGKLTIQLTDGFVPAVGQMFDLLDFMAASGSFASISTPYFVGGKFDTTQLATDGTVTVVAPEPGCVLWLGAGLFLLRRKRRDGSRVYVYCVCTTMKTSATSVAA